MLESHFKEDLHYHVLITLYALICSLFYFGVAYPDSRFYISVTRYFLGITSTPHPIGFAIRPLIPLLASPLNLLTDIRTSYGILNTILYLGSCNIIYIIAKEMINSRRAALYSSLLLAGSLPSILFFPSIMTESGGVFFSLLTIYVWLKLMRENASTRKWLISFTLLGLGALSREIVYPAALSAALLTLIEKKTLKKSLACFSILVIPLTWNILTTLLINYNYLAHYLLAVSWFGTPMTSNPLDIVKAFILGHFPYAIFGLMFGFLLEKNKLNNLRFYCLLLPAIIAFLLWPYRDLRIAVASFYATMIISGYGMEIIINSLTQKPLLNKIRKLPLEIIIFSTQIAISVLYGYHALGFISTPWSPHDFSPSALLEGLE